MRATILGKTYKISETTTELSGGDLMGAVHRGKQLIVVRNDSIGRDQYLETILHEALHVIDEELSLGLSEETVARLSVGLYSAGCRIKVEK